MELQLAALRRAGVCTRCSSAARPRLAPARRRGRSARRARRGRRGRRRRELGADVVHLHNMLPLFGPRSLAAARDAGAPRGPAACTTCACSAPSAWPRATAAPAFAATTASRCPGSCSTAAARCPRRPSTRPALARHQPAVLRAVDRFVVPEPLRGRPGRGARAARRAGVEIVPHYLPRRPLRAPFARRRGPARAGRRPALAGEGDRHRDRGARPGGRAAADRRRGAGAGRA